MPEIVYPFDPSGVSPANKVTNEVHTVTEANFRDYFFIVPNFSPFYVDGFKVTYFTNTEQRDLVEGIDFNYALPYIAGIRTTGKIMYGAITLNNLSMVGLIRLEYQTLGGDAIANRLYVLQYLAEKAYNPKTTLWDVVTDKPDFYPPVPHYQDYSQFYGQNELIAAINALSATVASGSGLNPFIEYLNAHKPTKDSVGLSEVENLPLASEYDVTNLQRVEKYITLRQMLDIIDNAYVRKMFNVSPDKLLYTSDEVVTIGFDTLGIPVGRTYYWSIEHIDSLDAEFVTTRGSFTTDNSGVGSFQFAFTSSDVVVTKTFQVQIRMAGVYGPVVCYTPRINVKLIRHEDFREYTTRLNLSPIPAKYISAANLYNSINYPTNPAIKEIVNYPNEPSYDMINTGFKHTTVLSASSLYLDLSASYRKTFKPSVYIPDGLAGYIINDGFLTQVRVDAVEVFMNRFHSSFYGEGTYIYTETPPLPTGDTLMESMLNAWFINHIAFDAVSYSLESHSYQVVQ